MHGVRLTSLDSGSPTGSTDIVAVGSLSLVLSEIPRPRRPFRVQRIDLARPTIRLVRARAGEASGRLVGWSDLLKKAAVPDPSPKRPSSKLSEYFQVRNASIANGSFEYDARGDGDAAARVVDEIFAKLQLDPGDPGIYDIDFSIDRHPALAISLRGQLFADAKRLEIAALSSTLELARDQDQNLNAALQKLLSERDITGHLKLAASGSIDFDDDASRLHVDFELSDAGYTAGNYRITLDHVTSRISVTGKTVALEELAVDTLGGHVGITGTFERDESIPAALTVKGTDLQIGDLLRASDDVGGVSSFSGLMDVSGTFRGPLTDIARSAQGSGHLTLRKARLARLPLLSTIDEDLDRVAEAYMKREHTGHDQLSLDYSFEGDHAQIAKLRMNSRWYGLRGHGNVYFDSRLDLALDGGPIQKVENEVAVLGDVLGEITETLIRARVSGTLAKPEVGIEVLRHSLRP